MTTPEQRQWTRFWVKVEFTSDCWVWTAGKTAAGYGLFWNGCKRVYAHRLVYEIVHGSIPAHLQIDHLCRNRACVNPEHLEAVTQRVNIARGHGFHVFQARKTHCPKGHLYSPENTYVWKNTRRCRECVRTYQREVYHRKRRVDAEG